MEEIQIGGGLLAGDNSGNDDEIEDTSDDDERAPRVNKEWMLINQYESLEQLELNMPCKRTGYLTKQVNRTKKGWIRNFECQHSSYAGNPSSFTGYPYTYPGHTIH